MSEAKIIINGFVLNDAESMTLRVSIQSLIDSLNNDGLGDDSHGFAMTKAYLHHCGTINKKLKG